MKFSSLRLRIGRALPARGRVAGEVVIAVASALISLLPCFVHAQGLLYEGKPHENKSRFSLRSFQSAHLDRFHSLLARSAADDAYFRSESTEREEKLL
jgi:hypothetical protein